MVIYCTAFVPQFSQRDSFWRSKIRARGDFEKVISLKIEELDYFQSNFLKTYKAKENFPTKPGSKNYKKFPKKFLGDFKSESVN